MAINFNAGKGKKNKIKWGSYFEIITNVFYSHIIIIHAVIKNFSDFFIF